MKVCPTLISLGAAMAIAATAATGQSKLQSSIYQSIENLSTDELRLGALARLENFGPLVVPELRKRLHWQKRGDLTRQQQVDLLYVLGTLGKHGVPAMPELLSWLSETDVETIDQLLTTLTYFAPHLDQEQLIKLGKEVPQYRLARRRSAYGLLLAQIELGAQPTARNLIAHLRSYDSIATAACRKICAGTTRSADDERLLMEALQERLQQVTKRTFISLRRGALSLSGELAEAWLVISGKAPNALIARGLLTHRLPTQRMRGILWLKDHGRNLPAEERCDIAVRLWDGDDNTVAVATRTLSHWGREGALGLAPLLRMADQHAANHIRKAASKAAKRIGEELEGAVPKDRAWLTGAHAILRGEPTAIPTSPPTPSGKRLLAEMMMMAQWNPPERLAKLLTFVDACEPSRELAGTIYGWLASKDPPLIDATLAWLANNAKHTVDIADSVRHDDPSERWQIFALWNVPRACRGTAIEAIAWFQSVDATTGEFVDMLDSHNTRMQARGLAELLLRPADRLQAVTPRLRELANLHHEQPLEIHISGFNRMPSRAYLLAEPVRMLATMALARMGKVAKEENGLGELVKKHFGCTLDDLPATIGAREQAATMADQVEIFEAMCRRQLYVPAQLSWPRAKQ